MYVSSCIAHMHTYMHQPAQYHITTHTCIRALMHTLHFARQHVRPVQDQIGRGGVNCPAPNKIGIPRGGVNFWAGASPML